MILYSLFAFLAVSFGSKDKNERIKICEGQQVTHVKVALLAEITKPKNLGGAGEGLRAANNVFIEEARLQSRIVAIHRDPNNPSGRYYGGRTLRGTEAAVWRLILSLQCLVVARAATLSRIMRNVCCLCWYVHLSTYL